MRQRNRQLLSSEAVPAACSPTSRAFRRSRAPQRLRSRRPALFPCPGTGGLKRPPRCRLLRCGPGSEAGLRILVVAGYTLPLCSTSIIATRARLCGRSAVDMGGLVPSTCSDAVGRLRLHLPHCRRLEVGPVRLSICSSASRAPLLLLPAVRRQSLSRSAGSISAGSEGTTWNHGIWARTALLIPTASKSRCRPLCHLVSQHPD